MTGLSVSKRKHQAAAENEYQCSCIWLAAINMKMRKAWRHRNGEKRRRWRLYRAKVAPGMAAYQRAYLQQAKKKAASSLAENRIGGRKRRRNRRGKAAA
jgi:hypothetical protein